MFASPSASTRRPDSAARARRPQLLKAGWCRTALTWSVSSRSRQATSRLSRADELLRIPVPAGRRATAAGPRRAKARGGTGPAARRPAKPVPAGRLDQASSSSEAAAGPCGGRGRGGNRQTLPPGAAGWAAPCGWRIARRRLRAHSARPPGSRISRRSSESWPPSAARWSVPPTAARAAARPRRCSCRAGRGPP